MKVTKIPTIPISAKEKRKLDNCAIWPIRGGNIRKPKKPTVETTAIAMPADILRERPARL